MDERTSRLKELMAKAGINYYERVRIVADLLNDRAWLRITFNGDAYEAAQWLESEFLHDITAVISVWELLQIYRRFPDVTDWGKRKYRLKELWDEARPREPRRTAVKEKNAKAARPLTDQERLAQAKHELEQLEAKVEKLRAFIRELEAKVSVA